MRKSSKKDFVVKHLDIIFASVRHTDQLEREVGHSNFCNSNADIISIIKMSDNYEIIKSYEITLKNLVFIFYYFCWDS